MALCLRFCDKAACASALKRWMSDQAQDFGAGWSCAIEAIKAGGALLAPGHSFRGVAYPLTRLAEP
jgi:hypothetical protein